MTQEIGPGFGFSVGLGFSAFRLLVLDFSRDLAKDSQHWLSLDNRINNTKIALLFSVT